MTLSEQTEHVRASGEKALVPFFTAGYPDEETFLQLAAAASGVGCPVIEIGIPFSDPIADGPVIQASSEQALANGMTLKRVLSLAREASAASSSSVVLMGYLNPILSMGLEGFAEEARDAGVAGVIIPDVPFEESANIRPILRERGLAFVDLVALTSDQDRIAKIARPAEGFIYLVSLTGVTGAKSSQSDDLAGFVERVRKETELPLFVGFGIATPDDAARTVHHADGVIIGSALIRIIQSSSNTKEAVAQVERFLKETHQAINPTLRSRKA